MHFLIIGCGYLGERAANAWLQQGHRVTALTRNPQRAERWRLDGLEAVVGDVLDPAALLHLPGADVCLYAVGFDRFGGADKRAVYVDGLKNVLFEVRERVPRLIAISSTSVYGQDEGQLVDDDSPCQPITEGGRICLEAEEVVRSVFDSPSRCAVILRLAGIYGPGRLIGRLDQLKRGEPVTGNPDAWLNLIHVDDAVQAAQIVAVTECGTRTWLLSDGNPLRRREFYSELAAAAGAPPPVFSPGTDSSLNKRCDSSRIRKELGLQLRFPNAIDALPELLQK